MSACLYGKEVMLGLISLVSRRLSGSRLGFIIVVRRLVGIVSKLAATTRTYSHDILAGIPGKPVSNRWLGGGLRVGGGRLEGIVTIIQGHGEEVFIVGNEVNNLILWNPGHPLW